MRASKGEKLFGLLTIIVLVAAVLFAAAAISHNGVSANAWTN